MFKLIREETAVEDAVGNQHQWPVKFTATYTEDDEPAFIFVMQASTLPDVFADSLSCIASAIQMTDLPVTTPGEGSPFYRLAEVTKLCRSAKAATEFITKVTEAVQDLADNLQSADTLSVTEETIIEPTPP
jgi:hypothetical protein